MRRKDREVTEKQEIIDILDIAKVMRVAFIDNGEVYLVPVNYAYTYDDKLKLYFHGAKAGRKYELLTESPEVTVEIDTEHELLDSDVACKVSYYFSSIMGTGKAEIISDADKKLELMLMMLKHQTGREFKMNKEELNGTMLAEIVIDNFSCKRFRKKQN